MKPITREWIAKAEGDWRVANSQNRSRTPVYDAICFHAQQTVEKYLKAWLSEQGTNFPKIHDTEILLNMCVHTLPELAPFDQDARYLTTYAVEIRYPGVTAAETHAKKCIVAARKMRKVLRIAMGL